MTARKPDIFMWAQMRSMLNEADEMRGRFFELRKGKATPTWEPPADVIETATELLVLVAGLPLLGACSDLQTLGAAAAEQRRVMNDMQARATMAAVCDISLGAYLRELNQLERAYAGLVCGDVAAMGPAPLPERLAAAEAAPRG